MKEFQLASMDSIVPQTTNRDGNVYHVKPLFNGGLLQKCTAAFVEVEPGSYAYGYHYHESSEEIFVIVSGEGSVRTIKGEIAVKAGDAISFPTGEGGAHVIRNTSADQKLIYLDFGTKSDCDIAHLPDVKKIIVASQSTFGMFDEPAASV